jgi:cell division protein FtsW
MIFSASAIYAQEKMNDSYYFLKRQLLWVLISTAALLVTMNIKYTFWLSFSRPLMFFSICLLCSVFIPGIGKEAGGARRWIQMGPVGFQPSELAKIAIIIYMAALLSKNQQKLKSFFGGLAPPMFVLGICLGLILLQPDLGTCIAIATISFLMLFVAGVRFVHLIPIVLASLPMLYIFIFNVAYRKRRILAFLDPWKDPKGSGFQLIQSLIALGSGGLTGVGLGQSRQKLFYLPEAHTDFIFSIIGEELGFLASGFIVLSFFMIILLGFKIVMKSPDLFSYLLSFGITVMIGLQAIINIGVATGSVPTKGLPLPFISFGGSSLLLSMIGMGILLNISRHPPRKVPVKLKRHKRFERTPRKL